MARSWSPMYLAAFLSGAGALVLETVWVRHFALLIGANTPSVSAVLSVYMAGLALGSLLGPRLAVRRRRARYVQVELAIAVGGVALTGLLHWLNTAQWTFSGAMVVCLTLMFAVTLLMGTTMPLLVGLLPRHHTRLERPVGWLYATNTCGAAGGALLGGLLLLEHIGLVGASLVAAAAHLAAAQLAMGARTEDSVESATTAPPRLRDLPWILAGIACVTSLFGMAMEVLLARALVMILSSHAYAFALLLGGLLLGLAAGALLPAHWRRLSLHPLSSLALVLIGLTALAAIAPHVVIAVRSQEGALLGWVGDRWSRFLLVNTIVALLMTTPLGILLGTVPPMAVLGIIRQRISVTRGVGWVGLMSGLGSIVGPPVAAFVLLPSFGLARSFAILAAAIGAVAILVTVRAGNRRLAVGAAVGLLVGLWLAPAEMSPEMLGAGDRLVFSSDSSFGSAVVVEDRFGVRHLMTNMDNAVGDDSPVHVIMQRRQYLIPALLAPRRERVVEIGVGTGISVSPVVHDHAVERLVAMEISPAVADAARLFEGHNLGVLDDQRVALVIDDGRAWLRGGDEPVDLILVELFNGEETGISSLYSSEFFRLCSSRLRPDGVLALCLSMAELPGPELFSVLRSLADVFPTVHLWMLYPDILLATASHHPPVGVEHRMRTALAEPELGGLLRRAGLRSPADLFGRFLLDVRSSRLVEDYEPVLDNRPAIEFRVPRSLFFLGRNLHRISWPCQQIGWRLQDPPAELAYSPALLRQLELRRLFLEAMSRRRSGGPDATRAILERILAADPSNVDGRIMSMALDLQGG